MAIGKESSLKENKLDEAEILVQSFGELKSGDYLRRRRGEPAILSDVGIRNAWLQEVFEQADFDRKMKEEGEEYKAHTGPDIYTARKNYVYGSSNPDVADVAADDWPSDDSERYLDGYPDVM